MAGNDSGTQYRTGVYTHTTAQYSLAQQSKAAQGIKRGATIVTEVEPAQTWYRAEAYHQQYLAKGGQCSRTGDLSPIRCYG